MKFCTIATAGALTIAAGVPVHAQSAYCMPGSAPGACFTFQLLLEAAPDAVYPTLMTLRIRNLQGTITSDPAPFGINSFGVSRTSTPGGDLMPFGTDYLQMRPAGPLTSFGGPVEFNPQPMTPFIFQPEYDPDRRFLESEGTGIGGCASVAQAPEGNFADAVARTCAVQGLTGAIDVRFYIGIFELATGSVREVTADDISIALRGHVDLVGGFACEFNGAGSGDPPGTTCISVPFTTVPEPGTIALVAGPALALMARRVRHFQSHSAHRGARRC
jgi:hypothetical protein